MLDERPNRRLRDAAVRIGRARLRHERDWTSVLLLAGIEIGRGEHAMLEVVDAERDCFLKAHRAKMSGDLDSLLVRLRDRSPQLGAANVGVRLDPRRAF